MERGVKRKVPRKTAKGLVDFVTMVCYSQSDIIEISDEFC